MNIEKYLYSYTDAIRQRDNLLDGLKKAIEKKDEAYIPVNMAVDTTKARVQKSELESPVERAVQIIVDEYWQDIERIQSELLHYRTIISNVELWMITLEPDERNYIRYKYFEDKSVEKISELMHWCRDKVWRIGKSAMDKLESEYKKVVV